VLFEPRYSKSLRTYEALRVKLDTSPKAPGRDERDREREREREKEKEREREKERAEKERLEKERTDREKAEKERLERAEKERADREKAEKERYDKERADRERADRERTEKEKSERERAERERAEKERKDREYERGRHASRDSDYANGTKRKARSPDTYSSAKQPRTDYRDKITGSFKEDSYQLYVFHTMVGRNAFEGSPFSFSFLLST